MQQDNKTIYETIGNITKMKATLKRIIELRDGAFKAFITKAHICPSLKELLELRNKFWVPLYNWNSSDNPRYFYLDLQDWNTITEAFNQVHGAFISRREFVSILEPSRESVEKYIEELKEALSSEEAYLAKRYDKFVAEQKDDYLTIAATKHKNYSWLVISPYFLVLYLHFFSQKSRINKHMLKPLSQSFL